MQKGELKLRVQGEEVVFNVMRSMKYADASDNCFSVDILGKLHEERNLLGDALQKSLVEDIGDNCWGEVTKCVKWLNANGPPKYGRFEELGLFRKGSFNRKSTRARIKGVT